MPGLCNGPESQRPLSSPQDSDAILDEAFQTGAQEYNPQEAYLVQQTAIEELELLEVGPQLTSALAPVQPGSLCS